MSKIVEAINAMIKNRKLIQDVVVFNEKIGSETYFTYVFKYKSYIWSIEDTSQYKNNGGYELIYYPGFSKVEDVILCFNDRGMTEGEYVKYDSSTINTVEADESFTEFYRIIKEKLHNVDQVLDDIISDM